MGKIVISENVSLDGLAAGERLFEWVGQIKGEAAKVLLDEAWGTEALLLGRRSYEFFAARWPSRSGEYADRLNSMPKYIVSSTLEHPAWSNTTVLTGDVVREVAKLRREMAGDIVLYGSIQLGQTLMEHDLVDELRLMIYPVVLGAGGRLFGETSDKKPMRLAHIQTVDDNLAFLTYQRVQDA
jgi:dihydrofolate reductase